MAFRNDRDAARQRIEHLEEELADAREEIAELRSLPPPAPQPIATASGAVASESTLDTATAHRQRMIAETLNPHGLTPEQLRRRNVAFKLGFAYCLLSTPLGFVAVGMGVRFDVVIGIGLLLLVPAIVALEKCKPLARGL